MSSATFNYYFRAELTLATYTSSGTKSTITVNVVNKPLKDSSSVGTFWPILESVGDITYESGEFLPSVSGGSITLNNTIGTFGANRKFSDLLQRYSVTDQTIVIYIAASANDSDTVGSWTEIGRLKMSDWSHAANGGSLSISITPYRLDERVMLLEVSSSVSGMENAPESSLGRFVPMVFGEGEVTPIRITADGATTAAYAVSSGLYDTLIPFSPFPILTKDWDDNWSAFVTSSVITNPDYTGASIGGQYTLNTYAARAFQLHITLPEVITGIQFRAKGNGTGTTSTALLAISILRVRGDNKTVIEEVAAGRVDLSYYDTQNNAGTSNFAINVSFDKPVLVVPDSTYDFYVAWAVTGYTGDDLSLNYHSTFLLRELRKDTGDANNSYTEWRFAGNGNIPLYKLHKLTSSSTVSPTSSYTSGGFTYLRFLLEQFTPDTGQTNPSLDTLQLLATVNGVRIPSSSSPLVATQEVTARLAYAWSGTAWSDAGIFDTTTLSGLYAELYGTTLDGPTNAEYGRELKAVYDSRVTLAEMLADICRGTASKIGIRTNGKLFMMPWGTTRTVSAEIPAADITPLDWQQRDISTVVNRITVTSGRSPLYFEDTGSDIIPEGYESSAEFSSVTSAWYSNLTQESRVMYGDRPAADAVLNAYSSDEVVARYYLTRFAKPAVYASFVVPWHRYSALQMFDVITFQHPEFPAFYGTDPEPALPAVDSGASGVPWDEFFSNFGATTIDELYANGGTTFGLTVQDVNRTDPGLGYEFTRSETYRGIIEGISYVMDMQHAPAIKLTVLVLLNQPWDPT